MNWYEISVKTSTECIEAVNHILTSSGASGIQIIDPNDPDLDGQSSGLWDFFEPEIEKLDFEGVLLKCYLEFDEESKLLQWVKKTEEKVKALKDFHLDPGLAEIHYLSVDPKSWENEWKKYFKPFELGENMLVKPSWENVEKTEGKVVIEIDPGNAFGSGTHETTYLCLEAIEKYLNEEMEVVDVGCGSGILSIASGLLGAAKVVGVDIDPVAVKTARENIEKNNLGDKVTILEGDLAACIEKKADFVVANILAEVILILLDDIYRIIKPGGLFVASGIILQKKDLVIEKMMDLGLQVVEVVEKGEWCVIVSKVSL